MGNLVETLLENPVQFQEEISKQLGSKISPLLEQFKMKVISEKFNDSNVMDFSSMPQPGPNPNITHDLVYTGQKFGFEPFDNEKTIYGTKHHLKHPLGHDLVVHQGSKKTFWAHHSQDEGDFVNHGHGESVEDLRKHLGKMFPLMHKREVQAEEISKKFGKDNIQEALENLK